MFLIAVVCLWHALFLSVVIGLCVVIWRLISAWHALVSNLSVVIGICVVIWRLISAWHALVSSLWRHVLVLCVVIWRLDSV